MDMKLNHSHIFEVKITALFIMSMVIHQTFRI